MQMLVLPVANGILPRPEGGKVTGMFLMGHGGDLLRRVGIGNDIMICPWIIENENLYPVGVMVRIADMWSENAIYEDGTETPFILAVLEGRSHARINGINSISGQMILAEVESINLRGMRKKYPVLSGAGWMPEGGYTEFRAKTDIPVTIYGNDIETGKELSVIGNLGGLVSMEQAHTIEHAIIRSLRAYSLCTAKTLGESVIEEVDELKKSVECSIKYALPEVLGLTASGACGNPMTNLAQFYLAEEFMGNLKAGQSMNESLHKARKVTMSHLSQDLGITMKAGLRVMQGLKKGMSHDDTPVKFEIMKKVIRRFQFDPWS